MKILILLIFCICFSTNAVADRNDKHFHHETYKYALSSKILGTAAKCEVAALKINYPDSEKYFVKAVSELTVSDLEDGEMHPSNELLEYKLAYNSIKSFHYGRLSVLEEIDEAAAKLRFSEIYSDSKCSEWFE